MRPALIAGALLAFTLSLDDFVITFFTSGPDTITFPVKVYSMLRFSVRSTRGWGRLVLPLVAVGLVGRTALACLHRMAAGARGRHAVPVPGEGR